MAKFKVGDMVRIKSWDFIIKDWGNNILDRRSIEYCNKVYPIQEVYSDELLLIQDYLWKFKWVTPVDNQTRFKGL
jgi:hypothetical protein